MKHKGRLQKKMENGEIDPHQTWLVNNMILMSDDGFKTSRSALGEVTIDGQKYYGLIAEMVLSGYIEGSIIKGGTIQIGEYIDAEGNKQYAFEVDKDGHVTMHASQIDGYATSDDLANTEANFKLTTDSISSEVSSVKTNLEQTNSKITQTADAITTEVNRATKAEGELSSKITQTADAIRLEVSAISVGGTNLLLNTNQGETGWTYSFANGTKDMEPYTHTDGTKGVKLICEVQSTSWQYTAFSSPSTLNKLEPNTDYTVSFDILTNVNTVVSASIRLPQGTGVLTSTNKSETILGDETWHKVAITFTTNDLSAGISSQVLYLLGLGSVGYRIIKNLKLEAGTLATDWSPAPEEMASLAEMNSAITQTAGDITLEVNEKLKDYSTTKEMNAAIKLSADSITSTVSETYATIGQTKHYGTCDTAAGTAAKVVACSGFTLYSGATISVKFTYANTVASPTLNVNSTGAKGIRAYGESLTSTSDYNWAANSVVIFVYDGTYWRISDSGAFSKIKQTADSITSTVSKTYATITSVSEVKQTADALTSTVGTLQTQVQHYGTCSTAEATAAKVVTCSGFKRYIGAMISVKFTYTNTASTPTLNVNSTGAAKIYAYNSTLTPTSNYNWSANSVVVFVFDGTYWRISDSGAFSKIVQTNEAISAEVTRATEAENGLGGRLETAESKITPSAIVSTVRSSTEYTNDLAALKITDNKIVATVTNSTEYKTLNSSVSSLTTRMASAEQTITATAIVSTVTNSTEYKALNSSVSSLTTQVSQIKQTSDSITLEVNTLKNKVPDKLKNSSIEINTSGITMTGSSITMNSGTTLSIASGGTVKISAGDGNNSYINFGEKLSISNNGITAINGNFDTLFVNGKNVLTADSLDSRIVVSSIEPSGNGIIWLKPSSASKASYKYLNDKSYSAANGFWNSTQTNEFTMVRDTQDILSDGYTYTYTLQFVIRNADVSNVTENSLQLTITAAKSSDASKSVAFSYTTKSLSYGEDETVIISVQSNVNLFSDVGNIKLSMKAKNMKYGAVYIKKNTYITLSSDVIGATDKTLPCTIYYIP